MSTQLCSDEDWHSVDMRGCRPACQEQWNYKLVGGRLDNTKEARIGWSSLVKPNPSGSTVLVCWNCYHFGLWVVTDCNKSDIKPNILYQRACGEYLEHPQSCYCPVFGVPSTLTLQRSMSLHSVCMLCLTTAIFSTARLRMWTHCIVTWHIYTWSSSRTPSTSMHMQPS